MNEGDLSASAPQPGIDITVPAISRQLKTLRKSGIVRQRVDAQRRLYSAQPGAAQANHGWTMDHRRFWVASLDRLETVLQA